MKLAWIVSGAQPLFGGAQISAHSFLRRLQAVRGWQPLLLTAAPRRMRRTKDGVPIQTYRDVDELKEIVARERPGALVCALDGVIDGLRVAARFGLPSILSHHSFEFCPPTADEVAAWGVSSRRTYPDPADAAWARSVATRAIANSRFLARRLSEHDGRDAVSAEPSIEVIHPDIEVPVPTAGGKAGHFISGICGHRYKGADIFLALADALPRERFLLIGDIDPALAPAFAARKNIRWLGRARPERFLRLSRLVIVPSQWPEPFGRIAIEAMASGIPTLVSQTGGLAEIAGGSSLTVESFDQPKAWIEAVSRGLTSPSWLQEAIEQGRRCAEPFLGAQSAEALAELVLAISAEARPRFDTRLIALCGGSERATAYEMINARWKAAAARREGLDLVEVAGAADLRRVLPDVTVHHNYGEHFATAQLPDVGRIAAVRTWDFGPYPPAWVKRIQEEVDLLLVYCDHVRRHAMASGIAADKVKVVPLGFDEEVFTPSGDTYELATKKRFRFLFVGAPVPRKGADVVLAAYRQAFGPDDDVCLVIKDHPHDLFYEGAAIRDQILAAAADASGPSIEYICELLPPGELAALYRTCDFGVFPYRAEGFCLPILEAMATGLPSIVPQFGAALDFCSAKTSLLMPVRRISLPVGWSLAINTLGFQEEVEEVDFCETPVDELARQMQRAVAMPAAERARLSRAGVRQARSRFTWRTSADSLFEQLDRLARHVPPRWQAARKRRADEARRREIALEMLRGWDTERR